MIESRVNSYFTNDIGNKLNYYAQTLQQEGEVYGSGMEKIIVYLNNIGQQQRNRISKFINKDFLPTDNIRGFYFLYQINWRIKDTEGKPIDQRFVNIDFDSNRENKMASSFPMVKLPIKYFKSNVKDLTTRITVRMFQHLENLEKLKKGEEVNTTVGVENLGNNPPYTSENFDIGAPDGPPGPYSAQHATAADARRALAIEYGFEDGSYSKYKDKFPSKAERDTHWLNNPQLW